MKISLSEIKFMTEDLERINRFEKLIGLEDVTIENFINEDVHVGDLLWLAGEKLTLEDIVLFSCDCASVNLVQIKRYCNSEQYEKITLFLNDPFNHVHDHTKEITREADKDAARKSIDAFGKDDEDPSKIEALEALRSVASLWSVNAAIKASSSNSTRQVVESAARAARAAKSAGNSDIITAHLIDLFKGNY